MSQAEDSPFHIRSATSADNILLAEMGAETFADSFGADNTPENMSAYLENSFSPEIQARELADADSKFLIIELDDATVGYAQVSFGHAPAAVPSQKPMEIVRIYARKKWIGKGVGAQLMKACLREAEQAGCDMVWLGVWERNPRAIAFYRKWGFEQVGTQTFQLGDDLQNDWVMARRSGILNSSA
jgi:GNAT superfamily N-acetyltransferase